MKQHVVVRFNGKEPLFQILCRRSAADGATHSPLSAPPAVQVGGPLRAYELLDLRRREDVLPLEIHELGDLLGGSWAPRPRESAFVKS